MVWWGWLVLGGLLFFAELLAIDLQFYLVFVGLSAAFVGLLGLFGIVMPAWAQVLVFASLSLISMFTFRKMLYEKIRGGMVGFRETLTDETLRIPDQLEPNGETRAELRGSKWTVRNIGSSVIEAGGRARVVHVDGLTLHVEADQ